MTINPDFLEREFMLTSFSPFSDTQKKQVHMLLNASCLSRQTINRCGV